MLDIKFIRENLELVKAGAKKKHIEIDLDRLVELDDERKELIQNIDSINEQKKKAAQERDADLGKSLKEQSQKEEEKLAQVMKEWQLLMLQVPNIPDMSVPEGASDEENQEIRAWGDKPNFSFEPKSHIGLMEQNNMVDLERGTKVSGFRGYFLKNDGALLNFAIWQFALEHFTEKGFNPFLAPSLVNKETLLGSGYLPQGEDDLYSTKDEKYFAGTAEVSMMSYHADEILNKEELPKKYLAFSPCYRREAGSHGKDTKGIYRIHEFMKFEQIILCEASHETSVQLHEELTKNSEEFLQKLGLPYHVVVNCGGDLGLGQVKKYDIEAWIPSQNKYGETHSSSYFHDFQTRRLNIKYRDEEGKSKFAHSLNNTAIATPRVLIQIVENYQQEDGTIKVPEALQKYLGKEVIGK